MKWMMEEKSGAERKGSSAAIKDKFERGRYNFGRLHQKGCRAVEVSPVCMRIHFSLAAMPSKGKRKREGGGNTKNIQLGFRVRAEDGAI